ncbi:MAG TPA: DUF411 domain-containing protein [Steroidobacteraceae bacterium]
MQLIQMVSIFVLTTSLAACGAEPVDARQSADGSLPLVVVYKSPTCGCCVSWVGHMRSAGFAVEVRDTPDLGPIKAKTGVPAGQASCHTALVGQYFVEGHVPADDVRRLLSEQPEARGLTVPRMPQGSPGMEQGGISEPYDVLLVAKDGSTSVFAHHGD